MFCLATSKIGPNYKLYRLFDITVQNCHGWGIHNVANFLGTRIINVWPRIKAPMWLNLLNMLKAGDAVLEILQGNT